jgi:hypothetical protein
MDLITDLPKTPNGHDSILVIVDRLTKMAHFIPCAITCTASQVAEMVLYHIFPIAWLPHFLRCRPRCTMAEQLLEDMV